MAVVAEELGGGNMFSELKELVQRGELRRYIKSWPKVQPLKIGGYTFLLEPDSSTRVSLYVTRRDNRWCLSSALSSSQVDELISGAVERLSAFEAADLLADLDYVKKAVATHIAREGLIWDQKRYYFANPETGLVEARRNPIRDRVVVIVTAARSEWGWQRCYVEVKCWAPLRVEEKTFSGATDDEAEKELVQALFEHGGFDDR